MKIRSNSSVCSRKYHTFIISIALVGSVLGLAMGCSGGGPSQPFGTGGFLNPGGFDDSDVGSGGATAGSGGAEADASGGADAGSGGAAPGSGGTDPGASGGAEPGGSGGADSEGTGGAEGSSGGAPGTGGGSGLGKFVGNITTGNSVDPEGWVFSEYWDQITPENAGKWGSVQTSAGAARRWGTLDAIYAYAEMHGITFKQHTFVWGSQQPSGNLTEAEVKSWIQEFCERYPKTALIDVVNEPPPHTTPSYAEAIGGGTNSTWRWIVNAFTWSRQYCPNAILILNDYNNIEFADQTQHFIDIANAVKSAGAPIDAVGAQAHGLSGANSSIQTMKDLITKLHRDTGLPVYITEYDIDQADDQAQLAKYQEHMEFFLETEWIQGITIWGWIHGRTWIPNSGLIRNGTPRPAMNWLMERLDRPAPRMR